MGSKEKVKCQTTRYSDLREETSSSSSLPLFHSIRAVIRSLREPGGDQAWQRLQARVMQWGLGERPGGWDGGLGGDVE